MNRFFLIALGALASPVFLSAAAPPETSERAKVHHEKGAPHEKNAAHDKIAPLLDGLGDHHHRIATESDLAQRYFDQGLVLAFGFNHPEAARSFHQVQLLDPDNPMGYWGEALVLGPNINAAMSGENVPKAWAALQKALELAEKGEPRHRDYVEALAARYSPQPVEDRSRLDQAYADAMRKLAAKYPSDYDAQALFAESLMDTTPWDYWDKQGQPKEVTREILATLEQVLARRPNHPLANHLYIHAVEAVHPEWGEAAADRLGDLVPGTGHLVHMPSHIYIRIGRYADANRANERAGAADNAYIAQCHAQGLYALGYVPHNHHFLWFGKAMTGESEDCLDSARHVRHHVDVDKMREPGFGALQHYHTLPMWTYVRFGMWDKALEEEKPAADLKYPTGVWHFARGMALAHSGEADEAQDDLDALSGLAADRSLEELTIWQLNDARELLQIAEQVLGAAVARARGDLDVAEKKLRQAVELEDALVYDEPPTWCIPPRQLLGAVLLQADKPDEAEAVYREELNIYPDNGWSLRGLYQALQAQGKHQEAAEVQQRFDRAWSQADVTLISSYEVQ